MDMHGVFATQIFDNNGKLVGESYARNGIVVGGADFTIDAKPYAYNKPLVINQRGEEEPLREPIPWPSNCKSTIPVDDPRINRKIMALLKEKGCITFSGDEPKFNYLSRQYEAYGHKVDQQDLIRYLQCIRQKAIDTMVDSLYPDLEVDEPLIVDAK